MSALVQQSMRHCDVLPNLSVVAELGLRRQVQHKVSQVPSPYDVSCTTAMRSVT